jgi:hypothetical protein
LGSGQRARERQGAKEGETNEIKATKGKVSFSMVQVLFSNVASLVASDTSLPTIQKRNHEVISTPISGMHKSLTASTKLGPRRRPHR